MIPVLAILMALLGLVGIVAGIAVFVLRRRGQRLELSQEQEETAEVLKKAFGKDTKWGGAGGAESEMHDHGGGSSDASDSGSAD